MTISSSELKKNMTLIIDGELYQVVEWQHRKPPKAPPTLTLRVKNIKNGNIMEVTSNVGTLSLETINPGFDNEKFNNDEDCSFSGILKEQYRMEPKICDLVSIKGYNGKPQIEWI